MKPQYRTIHAKPVELAMFGSMAEMAAQTGIPEELLKAAKREGCTFVRHGRCDLFTFLRWYFGEKLDSDEQVNWARRDKRAAALTREFKLEVARRSVIDFAEVTQFVEALVRNFFFAELDRIAQEFPPTLKGKTELAIHQECAARNALIKKNLLAKLDEWEAKKVLA